jgi:hypothetical protein
MLGEHVSLSSSLSARFAGLSLTGSLGSDCCWRTPRDPSVVCEELFELDRYVYRYTSWDKASKFIIPDKGMLL